MERRSVDFPHPEGPMSAVTARGWISSVTSCSAWVWPYQKEKRSIAMAPAYAVATALPTMPIDPAVDACPPAREAPAFFPALLLSMAVLIRTSP
jgi:hypothetical protein